MKEKTVLFGIIEIPDDKDAILNELEKAKTDFYNSPIRELQNKIDYLEYALDAYRRECDI